MNPAALTECFAVNTCLANFQAAQGGGGGVTQFAGHGPASAGDPALAYQAASQAMMGVATTGFSPNCRGFIDEALGDDVLESVQELASSTNVVNAGTVNTAAGVTLFPNNPALAAVTQNNANVAAGVQGATLAQWSNSAAGQTTSAWGQFGGNTVFYTNSWANFGPAVALYSMLHEMLHIDGFSDGQIQAAFGITVQNDTTNITTKLMLECGQT
jgi:hypothetical protein